MTRHRKRHSYREPVVQPLDQSIKIIALTQGQVTIVDAFKYEWAMQTNWWARWDPTIQGYYALGPVTFLHRLLIGAKPEERVDHKNGNTLDNRLENLRIVNRPQNRQNRGSYTNNKSGHPGVIWKKRDERWEVYINAFGKRTNLGYFKELQPAIDRRKAAEIEFHGEFAFSMRKPKH